MKIIATVSACFLIIFSACNSNKTMSKPINERQKPATEALEFSDTGVFDTQGHRGCRGLMPENTIPAMIHALGLGVVTLEMDVVVTKDNKLILSHEPFFNHEITTKPDGNFIEEKEERSYNIYQMNYDSIVQYDIGMKPHPRFEQQQKMKAVKPLLSDVFDAVKNYMMMSRRPMPFFNIETKCLPITDHLYHPEPKELVELLMKLIIEKGMENQVLIQSFDFRTLQYLHKNYPDIPTVMLIEDTDTTSFENQLKKLGFIANVYSPHSSLVNRELVKKCHNNHMRIIPWTVNDKEEIKRLKMLGVDGLISDYPNLFNE
jgi:glycerophosphoryl diester phosphodiesterase